MESILFIVGIVLCFNRHPVIGVILILIAMGPS